MTCEIVIAGFGGQGVMLMGQLLAYAGMTEDRHVSWIPSYGPEMRGGTANCSVIVSDKPVGAPVVSEPDLVVAMNLPSLDKFELLLKPGGILIINSSLIEREAKRADIKVYRVPAHEMALELGNAKTANMVILGALLSAAKVVSTESMLKALANMFAQKADLLTVNQQAIQRGIEYIKIKK